MKINPSTLLNVVLGAGLVAVSAHLAAGKHPSEPASDKPTTEADTADAVYRNIMSRTSVRAYADRAVEKEKTDKLLHAGMAAPTAMNRQPWHFVVVDDRQLLNAIAKTTPNAGMAKNAPLAIIVCGDSNKFAKGEAREMWIQDASAATENILLQAHAMGLGAVWTGTFPAENRIKAISSLLGMPDNLIPFCTIVIGYPKSDVAPKDKWDEQNVSHNHF